MSRGPRDWDERADVLSAQAIAAGEPSAWFERLYAGGLDGTTSMPWDRDVPNAQLLGWWGEHAAVLPRGRAVVVGCGLGADAEHLAAEGFDVTGFDVAPTAVDQARVRHPGTRVDYRVANLLDLAGSGSADLVGAADLVVEIFTLQALPDPPRADAAAAVASLVAPGGTVVAVAFRGSEAEVAAATRPPFPLTEADLDLVAVGGVVRERTDVVADGARWCVTYRRPV